MLRWAALVGFLGGIGAAAAEPARMTADDIKRVMQPGAVLAIDTPLRTVIPVKVDSSSMVSAEAGALGLTLGALKDRGRWWTEGDQLCMKWFRWFDAKARCITLQREGDRVRWHENSGESGTATITEAPIVEVAKVRAPEKIQVAAVERHTPAPEVARAPVAEAPRLVAPAPIVSDNAPRLPRAQADVSPPVERKAPPVKTAAAPKVPAAPAPRRQPAAKTPAASQQTASNAAPRKGPRPAAPSVATSSISLVSFRVSRVDDGDMLNVRSGPSEYHEAVGAIPARGRGVQIIGACRDLWCPIRHGSLRGWVNRYYLAEDGGQAVSANR